MDASAPSLLPSEDIVVHERVDVVISPQETGDVMVGGETLGVSTQVRSSDAPPGPSESPSSLLPLYASLMVMVFTAISIPRIMRRMMRYDRNHKDTLA